MFDPLDPPVDHAFETVDRQRHVDFLGCGIARRRRRFVMGAEPDAAVFRFEVEPFGDVET